MKHESTIMYVMAVASKPRTKRGEQRRAEILAAAEQVFGTRGYAETSVAEITTVAGTAQGTLYIYFSGKDEIFTELVREMGRMTRAKVGRAVQGANGRMDAERRGLAAFLRIAAERPTLYRIVEEARFVAPDAYRAYFADFANAYRTHLDAAVAAGEIRLGDNEVRAWALMGMAKTLGERFILWGQETDIDRIVDHAIDMIDRGLRAP